MPAVRSKMTISIAKAMNWVKTSARIVVTKIDHTKMGILNQPIPGARMVTIVATKLIAPMIDERPRVKNARL